MTGDKNILSKQQPLKCPCVLAGPECEGFHLIKTLSDSGIDVYLTGRQHDHDQTPDSKPQYAMVLENTKSNDHLAMDVISELEKSNPACQSCDNVMKRAQMILYYMKCLKKKDILAVCGHCSALGRKKPSCDKCEDVADRFRVWKRIFVHGELEHGTTIWLDEIDEALRDMKEPDIKARRHAEQDLFTPTPKPGSGKEMKKIEKRNKQGHFHFLRQFGTDQSTYKTDLQSISDSAIHKKEQDSSSSSDSDVHDKKKLDLEIVKNRKLRKYHSLDTVLTSINKKHKSAKNNFVYLFPEELKKKTLSSDNLRLGGKKKLKDGDDEDAKKKSRKGDGSEDTRLTKGYSSVEDTSQDKKLLEDWKKQQKIKQGKGRSGDDGESGQRKGKYDLDNQGLKKNVVDDKTAFGKKGQKGESQDESDKGTSKQVGGKQSKKGLSEADKKSRDLLRRLGGESKEDERGLRKEKIGSKKGDGSALDKIGRGKGKHDEDGIAGRGKGKGDGDKKGRAKGDGEKTKDGDGKSKKSKDALYDSNKKKGKGGDGDASDMTKKGEDGKRKGSIQGKKKKGDLESATKMGGAGAKKKGVGVSDLLMKQIRAQRSAQDNKMLDNMVKIKTKDTKTTRQRSPSTDIAALLKKIKPAASEGTEDISFSGEVICDQKSEVINEFIVGDDITNVRPKTDDKDHGVRPLLFRTVLKDQEKNEEKEASEAKDSPHAGPKKSIENTETSGVTHYALSDRQFIDMGWTMLPTEKVVRKMNVYRMRPAHPEFDWFEHNKHKKVLYYDTCEKLAEFDENGRGRWFYRSGRLALDYYEAEESNAQQRIIIYGSGEIDERGRSRPVSVLAMFDYLGNGVVLDHTGKIRLKYNQTEGVILDRSLGPVSHWKWHTLNDPPILQQVMIDTQLSHKDQDILQMGAKGENEPRPDNEEMLAIEFDNFIKEKSKKLEQTFKPFQIKMKALKINEYFSLKVLDQASVYLIYRDGTTNIKLNIGMILDHKEIVDTDTAELGDISNSIEKFPARTESLEGIQRSVAYAQRFEAVQSGLEQRLRPVVPIASVDRLTAATSKPLRPPLRVAHNNFCPCHSRKRNIYPYVS